MTSPHKRALRIATLVAPSALAWCVAFSAPHPTRLAPTAELARAVTFALGPMWALLVAVLALRAFALVLGKRRAPGAPVFAQLDILTGSGSALAWLSAVAIMGAVWIGWASLAVVGLLGAGVFHTVVLLTLVTARGLDPMRSAAITRRFLPAVVTEGDDVIEHLRVAGARIPIGFRLFVSGRVGPRWATSRYVFGSAESDGEIVVDSAIGPAVRGDHQPEPLEAWLEDTFGLCRSARVPVVAEPLRVLPRLRPIEAPPRLLDHGFGPRAARPRTRLPNEGNLDLREYRQGDDVRRIHWVRSLSTGQLVVRHPDEVPPDRPRVRLVLDTFFPEVFPLDCDAPSELLDSLVRVWLAVGRALAESGARVTLVTAIRREPAGPIAAVRQGLLLRAFDPALQLGARVEWQDRMPAHELLTDEATFVVAHAIPRPVPDKGTARWIVVAPELSNPPMPLSFGARFDFPMGTPDNRWSRRRRISDERVRAWRDHTCSVMAMRANAAPPPPGSLAALTGPRGAIHLEALR